MNVKKITIELSDLELIKLINALHDANAFSIERGYSGIVKMNDCLLKKLRDIYYSK